MSDVDFDLVALAEYLHLDPAVVNKLAERGKIPARRVAGAWRFARAEIHQWLEGRIGVSDDAELERISGALERQVQPTEERIMSVAELLTPAAIEVPLMARTRTSVFTSMIVVADRTGWLWDSSAMIEAVRSREDMYPTALDNGVALMHPRRPMPDILAQPFIALGINDSGLPFASGQRTLTDIFFLILSRSDRGHLHTLARLSRLLADGELVGALRSAGSAYDVYHLIVQREQALLASE